MKKILIIALFILPCMAIAQKNRKSSTDSLDYYLRQLDTINHAYNIKAQQLHDSLLHSPGYVDVTTNIKRLEKRAVSWGGALISMELAHNDYGDFNKSITGAGFPALNNPAFRIGMGSTIKLDRIIMDIYLANIGFNKKSKKGEEAIKLRLSNFLQFTWGYDVLNSKLLSIYPYWGMSLRLSKLQYSKPAQINNAYTDLTGIINNDQSVSATSTRFGYLAGVGFDFNISPKEGIILFTKVGTNRPVGKDAYDIKGVDYKPNIKQADWFIGFGIKLVQPE
ncbi:MAG: hypothetical protein QM791_13925 [Ferruginibacter sp.]